MKSIHIGPTTQVIATSTVMGLIGVAVAAQLPEIRRYLKIRSM
jgi:hypothetical protein